MCVLVCLEKPETKHSATSQSQNHLPPLPGVPGPEAKAKKMSMKTEPPEPPVSRSPVRRCGSETTRHSLPPNCDGRQVSAFIRNWYYNENANFIKANDIDQD